MTNPPPNQSKSRTGGSGNIPTLSFGNPAVQAIKRSELITEAMTDDEQFLGSKEGIVG